MTTSINSSSSTVDDSYKYVETASDLNVEGVEFYLGEVVDEALGAPIYKDKECTQLATVDELVHFYNTNDLILVSEYNGYYFRSRVSVIFDQSSEMAKGCMIFYHLPYFNSETNKMELISKYSIVYEEIVDENNENENENENVDEH